MASCEAPLLKAPLVEFAANYHGYSQWFPYYLRAVIEGLDREDHKQLLRHNLQEEQGLLDDEDRKMLESLGIDTEKVDGIPHPQLFERFCDALGVGARERNSPPEATQSWRSEFRRLLEHGSPAVAVGALGLGTEAIVSTLYGQLLTALRRVPALKREGYVFFELHCLVDDQHQRDLLAIAGDLAERPGGLEELQHGMFEALRLREEFMDALASANPLTPEHD